MITKKILGLDLGTNSIGWALVTRDEEVGSGKIEGMGSRIIPMDSAILGEFERGNSVSQTAERTRMRMARRLHERYLLRRERLHRVLNELNFLPKHYAQSIDFERKLGQFIENHEPKIAYHNRQFLFIESFNEMVNEFAAVHTNGVAKGISKESAVRIPYDWTLYYLRKKALTHRIEKEELAWLLLNFNQKRGYNQARGEEEEKSNIREYVETFQIIDIQKGEPDKKKEGRTWYKLTLNNGWIYSSTFTAEPAWLNTFREFLITEELDDNGQVKIVKDKKTDNFGTEKRKISPLPSFEEIDKLSNADQHKIYKKIKAKTEASISRSGLTVGQYIYQNLLEKPYTKINGKLVRTIDRKFYKEEIRQILTTQLKFHPELKNTELLRRAISNLYKNNEAHQNVLQSKDFIHLFVEDILYYQRPLKSKKSSIADCPFEERRYKHEGVWKQEHIKVIPKSHPLFQEFRVWQWMQNLRIYIKQTNEDVTAVFLHDVHAREDLFEFLMSIPEVDHKSLLKFIGLRIGLKGNELKQFVVRHRWNYVYDEVKDESKSYPCNETGYEIRKRIEKVNDIPSQFLTKEVELKIWHMIYSITNKTEYESALMSFSKKQGLDVNSFVDAFKKFPPFKSDYGAYSEKAIKKLLPLLRLGKFWSWQDIDGKTKIRIEKIIHGEVDENIHLRVREKSIHLNNEIDFQGLPLWLTSYIVYGRHAESGNATKWNTPNDINAYLANFKQHSLRNPIVEQVLTETLRVVRDIWIHYGQGRPEFFNEIHVELGREMKNTQEERKIITRSITDNENTNQRIKLLLAEFLNDSSIENVRPYSPSQQEILKIYEDGVLKSNEEIPESINEILKKFNESDEKKRPTSSDVLRYKLWLDQKYISPYTGEPIPLSKLFTEAYQIEHVIPQSRFFDDSMSNKVICEAAVNALKDNQLGFEFIRKHAGEIVQLGFGRTVKILSIDDYQSLVETQFQKNKSKRTKLLLEEIPDKMVERQLNDTRYISKFVSSILSNIVRANQADDGVNSKNLIPGNGKVTSILRKDWGLDDVWNAVILPRFIRLNELTNSTNFTAKNKEGHLIPTVPMELSKGFQKKRIDHRHHALDALVIACATRDHINLLNNQSANSPSRYDLQYKLRETSKWIDANGNTRTKFTSFKKPWPTFNEEAKVCLDNIIVSFKQNLRVINKATNYYEKWVDQNGQKKKMKVAQEGLNWAIRKPLSKDTVSGIVQLPRIKVPKGKILTATRRTLDTTCDLSTIESITDTGIQKILTNYLTQERFRMYDEKGRVSYNSEAAFSPEGIEEMNRNISKYNEGKAHQPIIKFRVFETGSKFPLGFTGNKNKKYVEAAKGTNLFFAIYVDEEGKRYYETVPLNVVIERQKQGISSVPEFNQLGHRLLFFLSPNDLVYVISSGYHFNDNSGNETPAIGSDQVYRMVSSTDSKCYFVRANISALIKYYDPQSKFGELKSLNKLEQTIDSKELLIKANCVKIYIDRLGHINNK